MVSLSSASLCGSHHEQGHPGVSVMYDQCVCMLCVCVAPEGAGSAPQAGAPLKRQREGETVSVCV